MIYHIISYYIMLYYYHTLCASGAAPPGLGDLRTGGPLRSSQGTFREPRFIICIYIYILYMYIHIQYN